jgi:NCAIR mutase (PurE)-related protein
MRWATIELSNYPLQLTRQDVLELFQDFTISPDFALPNIKNLAYPLRTFIKIAGEQEAERAVQELCWSKVSGRQINVRIVEKIGHEEKEVAVADVADEMKIGILSKYLTSLGFYQNFTKIRRHCACVQPAPRPEDPRGPRVYAGYI